MTVARVLFFRQWWSTFYVHFIQEYVIMEGIDGGKSMRHESRKLMIVVIPSIMAVHVPCHICFYVTINIRIFFMSPNWNWGQSFVEQRIKKDCLIAITSHLHIVIMDCSETLTKLIIGLSRSSNHFHLHEPIKIDYCSQTILGNGGPW